MEDHTHPESKKMDESSNLQMITVFMDSLEEAVDVHLVKHLVCGTSHVFAANIAGMSRG